MEPDLVFCEVAGLAMRVFRANDKMGPKEATITRLLSNVEECFPYQVLMSFGSTVIL
jgi:hypothetical protein